MFQKRFKNMGKRIRTIVLGCLLAVLGLLAAVAVRAEGSGTVRLELPASASGVVRMTLYRVGEQVNGDLVCTGDFADCEVTIPSTDDADALEKAAATLESYAVSQGITGTEATAESDGAVTFSGLGDGVYLIVQSGGWSLMDVQRILLVLPYLAEADGTTSYNAVLEPKYTWADGGIVLTKTDDAGNALEGAEFKLQRKVYISSGTSLDEGTETGSDNGGTYYWQDVQTGLTTGTDGRISVQDLSYGTYRFVETRTPEGMVNEGVTATVTLASSGTAAVAATNTRTSLIVNKVDADGEYVAGAVLVIKDSSGNTITAADGSAAYTITTGETATVLRGLPAGSYYLSEITVPDGYQAAEDVAFTVSDEAGAVNSVTMVDEKIPEEEETVNLTVTKSLADQDGNAVTVTEATFYVALFSDEARTERVSSVQALTFSNGSTATVTFEGLTPGTTYYLGETDANGTLAENGTLGTGSYTAEYTGGYTVTLTAGESGTISFTNTFTELPDAYYKDGTITITKKTLRGTAEYNTDQTFYAGIFNDAAYTDLVQVVELAMNGGSSVSVPVTLQYEESATYYVTETDSTGKPLADASEELEFTYSVESGTVNLTMDQTEGAVTITNTFPEETQPTVTPAPTAEPTAVPTDAVTPTTVPGTQTTETTNVQTGDDTPILPYVLLAAAALAACAVLVVYRKKRQK